MKEIIILPEKVNLELAIVALNLKELPLALALNTIISYSNSEWLNIFFNNETEGLPQNSYFGNIYNDNDEVIDWVQIDSNLIKEFQSSVPKKVVTAQHYKGKDYISIHSWEVAHEVFFSVDTTSQQQFSVDLPLSDAYILRDDINRFKSGSTLNVPSLPTTSVSSEMKALALLARELADEKTKFQNGKKVNASSFKNHLISLAEKYNVSKKGLKSIDDKLNPALIHLDLNNINKSQ